MQSEFAITVQHVSTLLIMSFIVEWHKLEDRGRLHKRGQSIIFQWMLFVLSLPTDWNFLPKVAEGWNNPIRQFLVNKFPISIVPWTFLCRPISTHLFLHHWTRQALCLYSFPTKAKKRMWGHAIPLKTDPQCGMSCITNRGEKSWLSGLHTNRKEVTYVTSVRPRPSPVYQYC